jgi:hypothetical protein
MKPISEIIFGFSDAENYRRRENKELFNKFLVRTTDLDILCERNVFFIVGGSRTPSSLNSRVNFRRSMTHLPFH